MTEHTDESRIAALAEHTGYDVDTYEAGETDYYGVTVVTVTDGGAEYLVLTDYEADEVAREYVSESLWAFNAEFLAGFTGLPVEVFRALQPQCENANDAIRQIIGDELDAFTDEAVSADGRGHFLATWDGEEIELGGDLYAYRVN